MNVTLKLGCEFDRFVNDLVDSGAYATPDEVVQDALRLLKDREIFREHKLRSLRKDVAIADQQFKRGQYKTYTQENIHLLTESIKKEGRRRLAAETKNRNGARAPRV